MIFLVFYDIFIFDTNEFFILYTLCFLRTDTLQNAGSLLFNVIHQKRGQLSVLWEIENVRVT